MAGFSELSIALALFAVSHIVPTAPTLRSRIVARMGEKRYLAVYSFVSLALLVWVVIAYLAAPFVPVWLAPVWWSKAAVALMLPAVILVVAGLRRPEPDRLGMFALTRHPAMWGLALWAMVHVIANGDVAVILLFGVLGLLAVPGAWNANARWRSKMSAADWRRFTDRTAAIPFAALLAGHTRFRLGDLHARDFIIAFAVYGMLLVLHGPVIGYRLI